MGSHARGSTYQEDGPGEHLSGLSFLLCTVEVSIVRQDVQTGDAEGLAWSPTWLALSLPPLQVLSITVTPAAFVNYVRLKVIYRALALCFLIDWALTWK